MTDQQETRLQPFLPDITVAEVIETAMQFELNAFRLYRGLADRLRPELRPLLEELAAEELEHHRLLRTLAEDPESAAGLTELIRKPTTAGQFGAFVNLAHLPTDPLDDDVLAYAQDRERIACEHYGHLAEAAPEGAVRKLFRFLSAEEQKHEEKLTTRWARMFSVF
ncbi:MAG: ferritin family protein [Chromatiaceae bacterium]|jgi:rubrerythrin